MNCAPAFFVYLEVNELPYIHFTEEQKQRAASVDLVEFLRFQGERLIRSGPEYRMASDHSVTVRANEWYDHAIQEGGGPISFVQNFYGLSYPEAVSRLLDGEQGQAYEPARKQKEDERKDFIQPTPGKEMRRLYAYLLKKRCIDREVLTAFVRAGLIYEDTEYHNAVFIGKDEHGVARHAHKRSVSDMGRTFRINVEGSDPRCSFHWDGTSDRLYVFEAPIDLLSFLSLYPKDWQQHSYVALCGTSEHAMLWMLEQHPDIQYTALCLDHDPAGIEACGRLEQILAEQGHSSTYVLRPLCKDWNEDLKERCGLEALPAEEHPQLLVAPEVCGRVVGRMDNARLDYLEQDLPNLIDYYKNNLRWGRIDRAMDCAEQASALALSAYARELRQMGKPLSAEELADILEGNILPHQNRGNLKNRAGELSVQLQSVLALKDADGILSVEEKQRIADGWLELAVSFVGIPVKYEADLLKQEQKQVEVPVMEVAMG